MAEVHLQMRSLYRDSPPGLQTRVDMNPTLLVSWWCTIFALVTILIRLMGRWVRTERLFREDKIMLYSIIPLMIRMGFVHVILLWGTNNTVTAGLTPLEIMHRETGSKLVLASRIFYATFIWIAKFAVLEFLKRTVGPSWVTSYEGGLRSIYGFLALTYVGVIVGTLAECRPFHHYWQVIPDPGPRCREGLVQLITMGVCDMVSDVVLIVFPIPLVMRSTMPFRKKFSLVLLFLLSLILIAITAYRIPSTISRRSSQQYRSLLASLEILAAAGVSNAVVIGSFIRDKGVKKAKFRVNSNDETNTLTRAPTRTKSIAIHHWGSDEDLVRDMGVALPPALQHVNSRDQSARVAPLALPGPENSRSNPRLHRRHRRSDSTASSSSSISTTDIKLRDLESQYPPTHHHHAADDGQEDEDDIDPQTTGKLTFFDYGGLIHKPVEKPPSQQDIPPKPKTSSKAFLSDIGGLLHPSSTSQTQPHRRSNRHLTPSPSPAPSASASSSRRRRFSRSPGPNRLSTSSRNRTRTRSRNLEERKRTSDDENIETGNLGKSDNGRDEHHDSFHFVDAGGLLSR